MGKKGRQKFADVWANQTSLGKQFGLSAIAMGKKLKELGLRGEDGNPTTQALGKATAHRRRSRMARHSTCGTGSRSRN